MNDVADERFSEAGLRNQTRTRDAQSVAATEVRFTDRVSFLEVFEWDAGKDAIEDGLVWLSRTSGTARIRDFEPERPFDGREAYGFRTLYVECSYLARGQLHKGSFFCGVAKVNDAGEDATTKETALRLLETERAMQAAVSRMRKAHDLTILGGGALHLHDIGTPWQASPEESIEKIDEPVCATCRERIHYSNNAWRHTSTGRTEVTKPQMKGKRTVQLWDHDAEPAEVA